MIDEEKDKLDRKFALIYIKEAFWKTFHESGEIFFNYYSSDKDNERSTYSEWKDFRNNLLGE